MRGREEGEGGAREKNDGDLVRFLKSQRWFGDKGRELRGASFLDEIPVAWPNSQKAFAVARAQVETDAGTSIYQLFLPEARRENGERIRDALQDPEFLRGLADAWVTDATFEGGDTRWILESETETTLVVPPEGDITLASAEQTNSSVIFNGQAILKLFRKLEPGVHPDVEVTRFLTIERQFVHVPPLLGTVRFEDRSGITVAGMLQEFVQGAADAWRYVVERLRALSKNATEEERTSFHKEIEQLGAVTRALHTEMAAGRPGTDFDLKPATQDDLRRWTTSAKETVDSATRALERALTEGKVPNDVVRQCKAVVRDHRHFIRQLDDMASELGSDLGALTRTHGDYHLGQVLRSAAGQFLIIDFEGEPARPLATRRARSSPLRDVAGMLRSFAYAGAVASADRASDANERSASAKRLSHDMRQTFLRGYYQDRDVTRLLPGTRRTADSLSALFEFEKQFYELQYELDHRPDWVWVPVQDIPLVGAP